MGKRATGTVYLVGAGPGDPRLLTHYAMKRLAGADAVVYDRLIHPNILDLTPSYAERIYVGKEHGKVSVSQDIINRLLVEQAQSGKTVVRLKGGDPLLFGRGGEEASVLQSSQIPFEIIPGLSSSMASLSYAGIPMTHRKLVQGLSIVGGFPGHSSYAWQDNHAWIVLMGLEHVNEVVARALDNGFPADLPACAIEWGTWGQQRIVRTTLTRLPDQVRDQALESPCVLVFGENVAISEALSWWDAKPLHGQRVIVVSRYPAEWSILDEFREDGAEVFNWSRYLSPAADPDVVARMSSHAHLFIEEASLLNTIVQAWTTLGRDLRDFPNLYVPESQLRAVALKGFSRVRAASTVESLERELGHKIQGIYATFEECRDLPEAVQQYVDPWTKPARIRKPDPLWDYHLSRKFDAAVLVSPAGEKWYGESLVMADKVILSKE